MGESADSWYASGFFSMVFESKLRAVGTLVSEMLCCVSWVSDV